MRSLSILLSTVSLLSLTGCAMQSDLTNVINRLDGHDDQLGALADPEGVVFTTDVDGVIGCNTDELVNGHMTAILRTDEGHTQTVRGWERFMLDDLQINGDNECIDSAGAVITTERILATIGAGKVGIGGGVTVQCLTTIGEDPCVLKDPANPTPPDDGTSPA